jgi:hypothetical protein
MGFEIHTHAFCQTVSKSGSGATLTGPGRCEEALVRYEFAMRTPFGKR